MAGIFKAYDIRGIYGESLTEDTARDIGRAFVSFLGCRKVVVGRDMRSHSEPLFTALTEGLTAQGADVIDIGVCSTPMTYFANGKLEADASVMITASHNPAEWNGLKLCRENAIPISGQTGIAEVERIVEEKDFASVDGPGGSVSTYDIEPEYIAHVKPLADLKRPVKIAVDFANSMGIIEAHALDGLVEMDTIFDTLDGTLPNHEANPLNTDTLKDLQAMVKSGDYDFGVAFDGDADRAGFLDENGAVIPMDKITAFIAQSILAEEKGIVLYDLRSSWSVKEAISEAGGTPEMCRVGHAFIKPQMRASGALFAGELSGHYYFRDNYYTESSAMAVLYMANIVSKSDAPLSELIAPLNRYHATGEINSRIDDVTPVMAALRERYSDGQVTELDGLSVEYGNWWFNVRSSNTEPFVRLNLEADTADLMEEKKEELLSIIRGS